MIECELLFIFLTQQVAKHQGRRNQPSDQDAKMLNSTTVVNNTQVRVLGLTFIPVSVYLHNYSSLGVREC